MTTSNDPQRGISDAIEDQHGRRFFRFGTGERHVWLPFATVASLDHKTVERLSRVGVQIATNSSKEALKRAIEARSEYRPVSIADEPGWFGDVYVLRDGRTCARPRVDLPIIVFQPDERFAATSTLNEWQSAIAPVVKNEPLLLFALALSFAGPLIRFAPPDLQNLFVELVGKPHQGKSTLAKLMSSVWGGGSDRLGICQSWAYSPAQLDPMRSEYRDGLLVLDEALKAGRTDRARADKIGEAVIAISDSSTRRVFNTDEIPPIRQAAVSTSNVPMRDLVGHATDAGHAIVSRVLTVVCDRPFGVLDTVSPVFGSAEEAMKALDLAVTTNYGSAAEAFLQRLLRYSDEGIQRAVQKGMTRAVSRGLCGRGLGPRQTKTLAMIYTAGLIAKQLKIIPEEWGRMDEALRIASGTEAGKLVAPRRDPLDRIKAYVDSYRDELLCLSDIGLPMKSDHFDAMPGVWLVRDQRLVVSTKFFRDRVSDADDILREVDGADRLDHEDGIFSKKAPRAVTRGRRAYFFDFSPVSSIGVQASHSG